MVAGMTGHGRTPGVREGMMGKLRGIDISPQDLTFARVLERQAGRNEAKTFLLFQDRSWSYRELDRITNRLANGLLAFGIRTGEHVALLIGNCPETLFLTFA